MSRPGEDPRGISQTIDVEGLAASTPAAGSTSLQAIQRAYRARATLEDKVRVNHGRRGCSRSSKLDYARFVAIAAGSVFEVVSQATLGRNQGFLNPTDYEQLYAAAEKQSRMLSGLRKSLEPH